jgi:hypothetical protein
MNEGERLNIIHAEGVQGVQGEKRRSSDSAGLDR